ncbi:MAG: 2-hydroxyacyl-CoA dehydratase family protein [Dehalococcoidia bacterium]
MSKTTTTVMDEFSKVTESIINDYVQDWKSQGGKVVGYICCLIPKELIIAAGMLPFRVRGTGCTAPELAEKYTGSICCTYPKSFFSQAIKGEYDFLDGVVFPNNCDHYRRLFVNWPRAGMKTPFLHLVSNAKQMRPAALVWEKDEFIKLKQHMEQHFGIKITDENLWKAIKLSNKTRSLQRKLYELRKAKTPPISGTDTLKAMVASTAMPLDKYNQMLETLLSELKNAGAQNNNDVRLMIVSSCLDNPVFIKMIEDLGCDVVTDFTCFGSKIMWHDINEAIKDPMEALASYYLKDQLSCARFDGDQSRRSEHIHNMIRDFNATGVIMDRIVFCDTWSIFNYMMEKDLKEWKVPFLPIEREYNPSFMGQLKTRVQAFLEMLRS